MINIFCQPRKPSSSREKRNRRPENFLETVDTNQVLAIIPKETIVLVYRCEFLTNLFFYINKKVTAANKMKKKSEKIYIFFVLPYLDYSKNFYVFLHVF